MAKNVTASPEICGEHRLVPVDMLDPNPKNPNKESKFIFTKLIEVIRRKGFRDPIHVRKRGGRYEIINGEHRWRAAKALKMTSVPIIDHGNLSDADAAALLISMNELRGQMDHDGTAALVQFIFDEAGPAEGDEALQCLPYTDSQLHDLLDGLGAVDTGDDEEASDAPPVPKAVKIKPSDVAAALELEGVRQETLKALIMAIRKWRAKHTQDVPAWELLLSLLKSDRGGDG